MRPNLRYRPGFCLLLVLLLAGCNTKKKAAGPNWFVNLEHGSRDPYGSSIAYETITSYFPAAHKDALTKWFRYTSINDKMQGSFDSAALMVMLGLDYYVSKKEWLSVLKFAKAGNEVFLLSSNLDNQVLRSLGCQKNYSGMEDYPLSKYNIGTDAEHSLKLMADSSHSYGFTGRSIRSYFNLHHSPDADTLVSSKDNEETDDYEAGLLRQSIDTVADTLGMAAGKPDFIRYRVGNGHITLHAAPLVLSNYFLLQPGNRAYLDAIWHSFPANISVVYWNEYYKRSTQGSTLSVLFKYPAMRWALIIAAFALLLYVLFGLKRMQRIVPEIPPVENASVSFVETVGRLYFNKGNHANLAEKMIQHFLEWIRTYYYLDTSQINEGFARQLSSKSGKNHEEVAALLNYIHEIRLGSVTLTPQNLYELHRSIQSFYNQK